MRKNAITFFSPSVLQIAPTNTVRQLTHYNPHVSSPKIYAGYGGTQLLKGYTPHMVSIEEAQQITANALKKAQTKPPMQSGLRYYWLVHWDAKKLPEMLPNSVVQCASQANGNESTNRHVTSPSRYMFDWTQGARAQLADIIAAIARFQKIEECDFLKKWRENPQFENIFYERCGYLTPRVDKEVDALNFIQKHIANLFLNVERISPNDKDTCVQVLCFGLALGNYDFPMGEPELLPSREYDVQTQNYLATSSKILLEAQYRFLAQVAITEAIATPEIRIPLVMTKVGGGVFGNSAFAIADAIKAAEDEVVSSGVTNIDVCVSAWQTAEQKHYIQLLKDRGSQLSTPAATSIPFSAFTMGSTLMKAALPQFGSKPIDPEITSTEHEHNWYTILMKKFKLS